MPNAPQPNYLLDAEAVARLERLSRQTSLVAIETALEAAEDALAVGRDMSFYAGTARNVASHIIRAGVEMQQAMRMCS